MPWNNSYRVALILAGMGAAVWAAAAGGAGGADGGQDALADSRQDAVDHHPGDPVKQDEHAAMLDLVPADQATHVAAADGDWGDKATWKGGAVPGAGATVVIPAGRTVTIRGTLDAERLEWVRVDGTLRFDPDADTGLKVVTLVGNARQHHRDRHGEGAHPAGQDGPADPRRPRRARRRPCGERDPYDLSGGLLSHGRVRIFGAEYTSHATPTAVPRKGDTEVRFAARHKGWKVGDTLLFPGLDRQQTVPATSAIDPWTGRDLPAGQHQDEERTIRAVSGDGKTVTLDRPLAYQHGDIFGYAEAVPVGNLSRNVVIESENSRATSSRRGHVMFMHTQDVVIDSALFRELGRTNVEGDADQPGSQGRQAGARAPTPTPSAATRVHFHIRWGATYKQQPFVVRNCAVVGSPKLGIVNHGGYGLVDDNVSYRVRGSHFFTENGSEIGRFKRQPRRPLQRHRRRRRRRAHPQREGLRRPPAQHRPRRPRVLAARRRRGRHRQRRHRPHLRRLRLLRRQQPHRHLRRPAGARTTRAPRARPGSSSTSSWPRTSRTRAWPTATPFLHTSAVPFHAARCVGLASADRPARPRHRPHRVPRACTTSAT